MSSHKIDGLAVERAPLAAKADSAKNSTPVQPEDRQPNELVRRRKGAGPPRVISMMRGRGGGSMQDGRRRDWDMNNQGHDSSRHSNTQDNKPCYGTASSSPNTQGVRDGSSGYPWHNSRPENASNPGITNHGAHSPHLPIRRGRPLPLPPRQDNNRSDTGKAPSISTDVVNKPYSNNLPTLKPRPAFSGIAAMQNPKPAPAFSRSCSPVELQKKRHEMLRASLERNGEQVSSKKRRKIDSNTRPSSISRDSVSPNDLAQTTHLPESQISDKSISTGMATSQKPSVTPSPSNIRMLTSPFNIKREPASPLLIEERKIVTTYVTRFLLPENCQKTNSKWQSNRMAFQKEKLRELRQKGLELIGHSIMRDDGLSIEWKSTVPLWSDTLEPASLTKAETPNSDHGDSRPSTPINSTPLRSSRVYCDAMGPPSSCRTANIVERPSPASSSTSLSRVSEQQLPPSPLASRSIATVSPSPARSDVSIPAHRTHVPRGGLDLATAIDISQRTNATPSRPQSDRPFKSSSATLESPSATMHKLSYPSIYPSQPVASSPSTEHSKKRRYPPPSKHYHPNLSDAADKTSKGTNDGADDNPFEVINVSEQSRMTEAIKAGWTVIEEKCPNNDKGYSEEAEDEFDELMEDSEIRKIEVVEVEEAEQVAPVSLSTEDTIEDDDTLTRNFINGYMQLFETDRNSLVSLYAPGALLRYRLLDIAQLPSTSSPTGLSSFPFITARGHKEISSSLLTLDHIHFYQKEDEDGKIKIDLEYHREQIHDDISLYVRSTMTVDEDTEVLRSSHGMEQQHMRLVDHDFSLSRNESRGSSSAISEGKFPFLIRNHLIIMHEAPL